MNSIASMDRNILHDSNEENQEGVPGGFASLLNETLHRLQTLSSKFPQNVAFTPSKSTYHTSNTISMSYSSTGLPSDNDDDNDDEDEI